MQPVLSRVGPALGLQTLQQAFRTWPASGWATTSMHQLHASFSAQATPARRKLSMSEMTSEPRFWYSVLGLLGCSGLAYMYLKENPITPPHVYLDLAVAGQPAGRVVLGLFGKDCPQTVENFVGLATKQAGSGYQGSRIHQVVRNYALLGGDVTHGDGTGGASVYGPAFPAERKNIKHDRGTISMLVDDDGSCRSQFFITCIPVRGLDDKMAPFGRVLQGMDVVDKISCLPVDQAHRPLQPVTIAGCGVLSEWESKALSQ